MDTENINYDDLKRRGFLRAKQEGLFTLRTRMPSGNYDAKHLAKISYIAQRYGRGITHITVRQGIEIPFIAFSDIDEVEGEVKDGGLFAGTSGPRLRSTTTCPGNNWCKRGLINTFSLFDRIENELGIKCAMDLPHKFKIVISGCSNACTRAESSEIGIHGDVGKVGNETLIGYSVYLGGCGGKTPHHGFKLNKIFTEDEVLLLIERVVNFYKENAKSRQRLALLIKDIGKVRFLELIECAGL